MIAISDELLSALSTARELADGIRGRSTCTVKQITAAILSPYKGRKVPTVLIGGVSYGIFTGTNHSRWYNCKARGPNHCPAGRLDPNRPQGSMACVMRRLVCVNKFCAEVQAGKALLRVIRKPKASILLSSEVPCGRCVDWLVKHPFVSLLFFERMNENRVGRSPFKERAAYELSDLRVLAGIETYWLIPGPTGVTLVSGRSFEIPGWTGRYANRAEFPENGPRPVSDSQRLLALYVSVALSAMAEVSPSCPTACLGSDPLGSPTLVLDGIAG